MKSRVLVVDDERNLRVTLAQILSSHGYEALENRKLSRVNPLTQADRICRAVHVGRPS